MLDFLPFSLTSKLLKILEISLGYRKCYRDRLRKNAQNVSANKHLSFSFTLVGLKMSNPNLKGKNYERYTRFQK